VNSTAQERILADIERRWSDAVVDEKHRERAKLLILLVDEVLDEWGEVPGHFHAVIRSKIKGLTDDLHRMTTNEMAVVARAVRIAGAAIPSPLLGQGFKKELAGDEIAAIRAQHPPLKLKPSLKGRTAPAKVNGANGNGNGNGTHDGRHDAEPLSDGESFDSSSGRESDTDTWLSPYNPLLGPQQKWVHRPRRQYLF
jgi:hypothetical protein